VRLSAIREQIDEVCVYRSFGIRQEKIEMNIPKCGLIKINMLALALLVFGCALPFEWPNPNLEVIIPKEENMTAWMLSPQGDKIVYWVSGSSNPFLLTPATQQRQELNISYCDFGWLDDNLLWCINENEQAFVIPTDDFGTIPLQQAEAQQADLAALLKDKIVYKLDYGYGEKKQALLVLDTDYKLHPEENYLIPIKDTDPVWQEDYPVMSHFSYRTSIPLGEKVYSPDKVFYFTVINGEDNNQFVTIYKTATNEKLSEFSEGDPNDIEFGGWADDSSGVYFMVAPGGMFNTIPGNVLYKLKVPE
jgi:hypothetical protein